MITILSPTRILFIFSIFASTADMCFSTSITVEVLNIVYSSLPSKLKETVCFPALSPGKLIVPFPVESKVTSFT